jgi:hypothetical protein
MAAQWGIIVGSSETESRQRHRPRAFLSRDVSRAQSKRNLSADVSSHSPGPNFSKWMVCWRLDVPKAPGR